MRRSGSSVCALQATPKEVVLLLLLVVVLDLVGLVVIVAANVGLTAGAVDDRLTLCELVALRVEVAQAICVVVGRACDPRRGAARRLPHQGGRRGSPLPDDAAQWARAVVARAPVGRVEGTEGC